MVSQRRPRRPGGRRFFPRRKVCQFCVDKVATIDYKDVPRLRRFISDWGKIESRRKTGTCAPHQRALSLAIKRARYLAFLPYTGGHSLMELGRFEPRRDDRRRDRFEGRPEAREERPAPRPEAQGAPAAVAATPEAPPPEPTLAEAPEPTAEATEPRADAVEPTAEATEPRADAVEPTAETAQQKD